MAAAAIKRRVRAVDDNPHAAAVLVLTLECGHKLSWRRDKRIPKQANCEHCWYAVQHILDPKGYPETRPYETANNRAKADIRRKAQEEKGS